MIERSYLLTAGRNGQMLTRCSNGGENSETSHLHRLRGGVRDHGSKASASRARHLRLAGVRQKRRRLHVWPKLSESYRRLAYYVDRILKGASTSELPIERPTKFETVVNIRTAKKLGLTVPTSNLASADELIECAHP